MNLLEALKEKDFTINGLTLFQIYSKFEYDVRSQLNYTIRLFDEYTPHDKENHINNLHRITMVVLGESLISKLNASECFILSCSLIAHDWGMAVSKSEQDQISKLLNDPNYSNENFLPDEKDLLDNFIYEHPRLNPEQLAFWREYFRKTHQPRARFRIEKYFEPIDKTLGRLVGKVSEGHGLDIEQIMKFDERDSVLGQVVNTQCLAVYMRTIDLLDISRERTPYKLWKFVNPVNDVSKQEWEKHQSINSVVDSKNDAGTKIILIKGETTDLDTYYSLEDLRKYILSQIEENLDILKNKGKYAISFFVDWKIEAIGFEPINVRFEFDRNSIFKILSSQIYENDSLVFIRELIQNSVDAIRLRDKKLQKIGQKLVDKRISIEISTGSDFDTIIIEDNGVGMNEYIIKNYLSKIGKSFYNSEDFEKLGIELDNISKFGIGILSCFTITDDIKIITTPFEEKLCYHIEIGGINKHFKISTNPLSKNPFYGTRIIVKLDKSKLKDLGYSEIIKDDYENYIKTIANLEDIEIELKINSSVEVINGNFSNDSDLFNYTEIDGFESLKELFNTFTFNFSEQDDFFHYQGKLTFSFPKDLGNFFRLKSPGDNMLGYCDSFNANEVRHKIKWPRERKEREGKFPSISSFLYHKVYFKGIYLSNLNLNLLFSELTFPINLIVDIKPKKNSGLISIDRTKIIDRSFSISNSIRNLILKQIFQKFRDDIFHKDLKHRLNILAVFLDVKHNEITELMDDNLIDPDEFPVIFINRKGFLIIKKASELDNDVFIELPKGNVNRSIYNHFLAQSWSENEVTKVQINSSLLAKGNLLLTNVYHHPYSNSKMLPAIYPKLHNVMNLINRYVFVIKRYNIFEKSENKYVVMPELAAKVNKSEVNIESDIQYGDFSPNIITQKLPNKLKDKMAVISFAEYDQFRSGSSILKIIINEENKVLVDFNRLFNEWNWGKGDNTLGEHFSSYSILNLIHKDSEDALKGFIFNINKLLKLLYEGSHIDKPPLIKNEDIVVASMHLD